LSLPQRPRLAGALRPPGAASLAAARALAYARWVTSAVLALVRVPVPADHDVPDYMLPLETAAGDLPADEPHLPRRARAGGAAAPARAWPRWATSAALALVRVPVPGDDDVPDYRRARAAAAGSLAAEQLHLLRRAWAVGAAAHEGRSRKSGEP